MLHRFILIFFLGLTIPTSAIFAQNLGNSPYSRVGLGDLVPAQTIQNIGLGGLSVSNYNQEFLQLSNPAMSANKKGLYRDSLVKVEGGFTVQYKQFSTNTASEKVTAANIRYLAFAIPIGKRWNTTVSLLPFSVKNHVYTQYAAVQNDPAGRYMKYVYSGTGGLYQVSVNNGFGITKRLSAGLGLSYLFGPTKSTTTSLLITNPSLAVQYDFTYGISRRINHSVFAIKPALHYRKELYKIVDTTMIKKPQGVFWNVGFTAEVYTPMQLRVQESLIREDLYGTASIDSVINSYTMQGSLPTRFNVGFSIDRPNKWMIGVEGGFADWANGFKYDKSSTEVYRTGWNVALGGEIRPGTRRQWKAWTYRAGVNYTMLPYVLSGTQLQDISVSIGATMPVGIRANGAAFPKVNVAFVFGQRGTLENGLAKEVYGRLQLGILITDKWFSKRKIQ
jgi:hypothetical protein